MILSLIPKTNKRYPVVASKVIPGVLSRKSDRFFVRFLATRSSSSPDKLRSLFDDPNFFKDFNNSLNTFKFERKDDKLTSFFQEPKCGLFKNRYLTSPEGLTQFALESLERANKIVDLLVEPNQSSESKLLFIRRIDQLSDTLCRVIDVAEFIRVVHTAGKWIQSAQQTHESMFEFMNKLNTNVELYRNLVDILKDPEISAQLTDEELKVGDYLAKDFERSGIDLDSQTRDNFVNVTQEISLIGSNFNNGTQLLENYWCSVTSEEYASIPQHIKNQITRHLFKSGRIDSNHIPLTGEIPYSILTTCSNESLRKKIWILLHSSSEDQLHLLNGFLKYRSYLAAMLGYKSFSSYQLEHKMAKTPENVMSFLGNLQISLLKGGVMNELEELYKAKDLQHGSSYPSPSDLISSIKPWDRDYLLNLLQTKHKQVISYSEISEYLSIGTIMSGLNQLFTLIYNISLIPEPTQRSETWDYNQVRKLKVFDNTNENTLGYLYLDFWSPKVLPSHFTIVCLRQLNSGEQIEKEVHLEDGYQLPVISLVCNFSNNNTVFNRARPTLLSLDQVDTIFHEMGHAMHSMIGRTKLHNLAGTRCLTDFVELPSVLMEFFSKDVRVLSRIARHYETNEKLPVEKIEKYHSQRVSLDDCETYIQSKMAMLDQVLHSEAMIQYIANGEEINSTKIYHELEGQLKVFADKWSTWHGKFPHLFLYGAVYYSYLLDRAIAEKVWIGLFKDDPWSRQAGEQYKESILKWGGTKDPWECLADALGDEELRKGDERAMEIIGKKAEKV